MLRTRAGCSTYKYNPLLVSSAVRSIPGHETYFGADFRGAGSAVHARGGDLSLEGQLVSGLPDHLVEQSVRLQSRHYDRLGILSERPLAEECLGSAEPELTDPGFRR